MPKWIIREIDMNRAPLSVCLPVGSKVVNVVGGAHGTFIIVKSPCDAPAAEVRTFDLTVADVDGEPADLSDKVEYLGSVAWLDGATHGILHAIEWKK